jgi:hypothetical protein
MLAFAMGTNDLGPADNAARACSILPSTDKAELEAALTLGRTAAKVGKGEQWWKCNLLALGMAEYRSGNHAAALEALLAAENAGANNPLAQRYWCRKTDQVAQGRHHHLRAHRDLSERLTNARQTAPS